MKAVRTEERTLGLLIALLFWALQTQAAPLGERADQVPAQDQLATQVQDTTISYKGMKLLFEKHQPYLDLSMCLFYSKFNFSNSPFHPPPRACGWCSLFLHGR
uniref:Alpha-defensin N-terminal domain-containing protein n=1 Tax=Equus asinus asinus TaxID=83772 RepID=A0A8C4LN41_EQUAS